MGYRGARYVVGVYQKQAAPGDGDSDVRKQYHGARVAMIRAASLARAAARTTRHNLLLPRVRARAPRALPGLRCISSTRVTLAVDDGNPETLFFPRAPLICPHCPSVRSRGGARSNYGG